MEQYQSNWFHLKDVPHFQKPSSGFSYRVFGINLVFAWSRWADTIEVFNLGDSGGGGYAWTFDMHAVAED